MSNQDNQSDQESGTAYNGGFEAVSAAINPGSQSISIIKGSETSPAIMQNEGGVFRFAESLITKASGGFTGNHNQSPIMTDKEINDSPFDVRGTAGAAKMWPDAEAKLTALQLPSDTTKEVSFYPDKKWKPENRLTIGEMNGKEGYVDYYGNVWVKCTFNHGGEARFEWDVQLSERGKSMWGHLSRSGSHINVSMTGEITHGRP